MRRHNITAVALGVFFVFLIAAQFVVTVDVRHDERIGDDLLRIEEQVRFELSEQLNSQAMMPRPSISPLEGGEGDVSLNYPELFELELDDDVRQRARENGYELNYLDTSDEFSHEYTQQIELCAEFKTVGTLSGFYEETQVGRTCFERTLYLY